MTLKKFDYHEFKDAPNYWALKNIGLEKINLLVGKNATGKTRSITAIDELAYMLAGLRPKLLYSCNYSAEFSDNADIYQYSLNIEKRKIISEKLIINGDEKFIRDETGKGKIFSKDLDMPIKFQVLDNQLFVVSKRDSIQHPYLEKLFDWADGMRTYMFGSSLGKDSGVLLSDTDIVSPDPRDKNQVTLRFFYGFSEFHEDFKNRIIQSMKEIGYNISNINISESPYQTVPGEMNIYRINVVEDDRKSALFQPEMSQGMSRALSLLIHIIYSDMKKIATTILIDDIGEGLDFDRSSKLIGLLIDMVKTSNIQLIMSTNDRFIMNNVPLEYWQVIQRTGGECKVFNYRNSKEKFDEFKYTGLSNFDFLTTDYINSEWETV
jgi:AAA15 family ATPase/GTPase